jgi:DNA-binding NarL/FixJ family response regulator
MHYSAIASEASPCTVCILSESSFEFDSLKRLIGPLQNFSLPFQAMDYKQAPVVLRAQPTDVAIVSYHYGSFRGPFVARQLHEEHYGLRLIGFTDEYHERKLFRMLDACVLAFLTYDCTEAQWMEALETTSAGRIHYNQFITHDILDYYRLHKPTPNAWWRSVLDEETIQYAIYLYQGKSRHDLIKLMNKKNISEVNNDLFRIFAKHNCRNKEDLIRLVAAEGWMVV